MRSNLKKKNSEIADLKSAVAENEKEKLENLLKLREIGRLK